MIKLNRLYSNNNIFDPIKFDFGINIIRGEKSEISEKKIGVGKSICIEFINFCLLSDFSRSRLNKIPTIYSDIINSVISLDLLIDTKKIIISRSIKTYNEVSITVDGSVSFFEKIEQATKFLEDLYFEKYGTNQDRISFRSLIQPVTRDERSEFKDLIRCFDTEISAPPNYTPHLLFLNIDLNKYREIQHINEEIDSLRTLLKKVKQSLSEYNKGSIPQIKAHLNELESEVYLLDKSIEHLKTFESFDLVQNDIINIESKIKPLRAKQKLIKFEINQITSLPAFEKIDDSEVVYMFNKFKEGLGDMVHKSLEQVKEFKNKIDSFKNSLINEHLTNLRSELRIIENTIKELDREYSNKISLLDQDGRFLEDIKTSLKIFHDKNNELTKSKRLITEFDQHTRDIQKLKAKKTEESYKLEEELYNNIETISSFRKTILDIHKAIMGNKEAYFEINVVPKKSVVEFTMRIDDDGSHSTERMKVFIYDISLLLNDNTRKYHPLFLIHDNIFEDSDSLKRGLSYLFNYNLNNPEKFQYIVTLNNDFIDKVIEDMDPSFELDDIVKATFTKSSKFLKMNYSQITK